MDKNFETLIRNYIEMIKNAIGVKEI